jgi:phosphoribosyl 1,2-cyclic phosphate phosphodiesterase
MQKNPLKVEFLGTGTSQGVPVIGCKCSVCLSENLKDKRLRTSIAIKYKDTQIVIDSGPDFRQQILRSSIRNLDALLFTHEHKDHIAGMDDIRAFNYLNKKPVDIFCTKGVLESLSREFHYVFDKSFQYPGIPKVKVNLIKKETIFNVAEMQVTPIEVMHYKLPVLGFRIIDFTYITDANFISKEEMLKIKGTEVLVINALRKEKHISHFNLDEALALIALINPKMAYLTHLSHLMGEHDEIEKILPANVKIAYDGLEIEL